MDLPLTKSGHFDLNESQNASCIIAAWPFSYLLTQTSTDWKSKRIKALGNCSPPVSRKDFCLLCPSQQLFPNCAIKPNTAFLCCSPGEDRELRESGDGNIAVYN